MASAWPFLIARGRRRDYRTVLAPDLLPGPAGPRRLAEALPVGRPEDGQRHIAVEHAALGRLLVTARAEVLCPRDVGGADDDPVTDEHGRPLVHLYGLVSTADDPGMPSESDMAAARATAMAAYQEFLADEPSFEVVPSGPIEVRSASPQLSGVTAAPQLPQAPQPTTPVGAPRRPAPPQLPTPQTPWPPPTQRPQRPSPPGRPPTPPWPGEPGGDVRPRRPRALLAALVAGLLVVLFLVVHFFPEVHDHFPESKIDNLQVVSAKPERSCDNLLLRASFRLTDPGLITLWLDRDDTPTQLITRGFADGDQTVTFNPGIEFRSGATEHFTATTESGDSTAVDVVVQCRED